MKVSAIRPILQGHERSPELPQRCATMMARSHVSAQIISVLSCAAVGSHLRIGDSGVANVIEGHRDRLSFVYLRLADSPRLDRIEAEVGRLSDRVKSLETLQTENQIALEVFHSDFAILKAGISRLTSSSGDSRHPNGNFDGNISRFADEFHALKRWNQVCRFSIAAAVSNQELRSFLFKGKDSELFYFPGSLSGGRWIEFLVGRSSKFERDCILSQSSNDLYNLIDAESGGSFSTGDSGEAWVCVEFRDPVTISEVEIQSRASHVPRSFDVVLMNPDGEIVRKEIRDANLNGTKKRERYDVGEMSVQSLKIEQKGPNSEGGQFLVFQSLELFSKSGEFRSGVFRSLFREHRNDIRQFVCVTARDGDLTDIHSISPRTNVCTVPGHREWVEVDLIDHRLFISSYRLRRESDAALRSWSLVGSNDRRQGLDDWTRLDSRHESQRGEFEELHVFECYGGPFPYFRLTHLRFWHLELFGAPFPVESP
jgi:hypothetical protein